MKESRLNRLFGIQKGEERAVFLMVLLSFLIGTSLAFFYTASAALFMQAFDAKMLSVSFITGGLAAYLSWQMLSLADGALPPKFRPLFKMGFIGAVTLLLYFMQLMLNSPVIAFVLFTWVRVVVIVSLATFWGLAGQLLNISQGKRLFGLIGAGEVLSNVIGFFSIPLLLYVLDTVDLLLLSGLGLLLTLWVIVYISRLSPVKDSRLTEGRSRPRSWNPLKSIFGIFKTGSYRRLALLGMLPLFGFLYVDFLFLESSRDFFSEAADLAGFLGKFLGGVAIFELLGKTLLSRRLMDWLGVKIGMLLLPVLLAGLLGIAWLGGMLLPVAGLPLLFISLARLADKFMQGSLYIPSNQLLFQAIPAKERGEIQSTIEGALKPLGYAVAGTVLLLFSLLSLEELGFYVVFFILVAIGWSLLLFKAHADYKEMLRATLAQGISKYEAGIFQFGIKYLKHLRDTEDNVRAEISRWLLSETLAIPTEEVNELVTEKVPKRLPCRLKDHVVQEPMMLISGYVGFQGANKAELDESLDHSIGIRQELQQLLESNHMQPAFEQMGSRDSVTAKLLEAILHKTSQPALRSKIIEMLGTKEYPDSEQTLVDLLNSPSIEVRNQAIAAFFKLGLKIGLDKHGLISDHAYGVARNLAWHYAALSDLDSTGHSELKQAIKKAIGILQHSLLDLLSLIYGAGSISVVKARLSTDAESPGSDAFAIELIENLLTPEHKRFVVPFIMALPLSAKIRRISQVFPQQMLTEQQRLDNIISRSPAHCGENIRALALMAKQEGNQLTQAHIACMHHQSALIHETALHSSLHGPSKALSYRSRLPKPVQAKLGIAEEDEGSEWLTLDVAKLLVEIPIFAGLDPVYLFKIAALFKMKSVSLDAGIYGEHYLKQVFIITSGKITAHGLMPIKPEYLNRRLFIFGATNNGIERIDIHQGSHYLAADRVAFFNLLVQEQELLEHILSKVA